ncbi:MAG: CxxC-x17-CxxC domain-containing protein [Candidatus Omnitrophota bacterium]
MHAKKKIAKKKIVKKKIDAGDLLVELQARFDAIEDKLDALSSRIAGLSRMVSTEHDPGFKTQASVAKKPPIPQDRNPRERKMYKVICAQCKKECEVPFKPAEDRPVYCKTCYSDRRNNRSPRNLPDREKLVAEITKTLNIDVSKPSKPKATKTKKATTKKTQPKIPKTKSKISKKAKK